MNTARALLLVLPLLAPAAASLTPSPMDVIAAQVRLFPDVAAFAESDPLIADQWALDVLDMSSAWAMAPATQDVLVAVIDSGIDETHPDRPTRLVFGHDYVDLDDKPQDESGHGTAVTGILAAPRGNGEGIAGAASPTVLVIRVLDASNVGRCSDVSLAIVEAAMRGADVIHLSVACAADYPPLRAAVAAAQDTGAVIVAAVGNTPDPTIECAFAPAGYPGVVPVGSVGATLAVSGFSCPLPPDGLLAPGEGVLGTVPGGYALRSGTSFAAPYVSGTIALMLGVNPALLPDDVRSLLLDSADASGLSPEDPLPHGRGLLDPPTAVQAARAP